jgi:hypothetical protein
MLFQARIASDRRIHCIFYFFEPHHIRAIDHEFLIQLAGLAPIVPVVGKADTMTPFERHVHLSFIQDRVRAISTACNMPDDIVFDFHEEDEEKEEEEEDEECYEDVLRTASTECSEAPEMNTSKTASAADLCDLASSMIEEEEPATSTSYIDCTAMASSVLEGGAKGQTGTDAALAKPAAGSPNKPSADSPGMSMQEEPKPVLPRVRGVFAVVCDISGQREYPWGAVQVNSEAHTDFRRLQRLLLESDNIALLREKAQEMSVNKHDELTSLKARLKVLLNSKEFAERGVVTLLLILFLGIVLGDWLMPGVAVWAAQKFLA